MTIDLTANPLPTVGQLTVGVGAGNVRLLMPDDARLSVESTVTAGTLEVNGDPVGDGVDIRWASHAAPTPVTVFVHVGFGNVEVHHATR